MFMRYSLKCGKKPKKIFNKTTNKEQKFPIRNKEPNDALIFTRTMP